ncbi:MAG: hypothetical protein GVY28_10100, partial [Alphaproteobacteria bacterium]|jgi:ectoine hydroxylase-related dioxygenase (phytanoyl-CoA dioxygenase family)|nr:hypothetical protein [Alphaproteobacteria bacterium]
VLADALDPATLADLRAEAAAVRAQVDGAFALAGTPSHAGTTVGENYSIPGRHARRPALARVIAGPLMRALCAATIGPDAWLFTDQFLIKGPKSRMDFNWHQDGGYVPVDHAPFVVVWIPLDPVDPGNGTIRAIPFSRDPDRGLRAHRDHPTNADLVAYDGADPGDPVVCPAGSVVAFDSRLLHASDDNASPDRWRRVYQVRYTAQPVVDPATGRPLQFAKPVFGGAAPGGA